VVTVIPPDLPVIVRMLAPVTAELPAVSVRELEAVAGLGEKLAVTPFGRPDTEKLTLPLNPYSGSTSKATVPDVPWPRLRLPELCSTNVGAWIERGKAVVVVRLPEAPVMVIVLIPGLAVALAVTVRVLVLLVEVGESVAVTPLGAPDNERLTAPVNPY
jgi:hypothetical protein